MKYIRVKDNNYEIFYELQDNGQWTHNGKLCLDKDHYRYDELQKHIIKIADTIEELCDRFVVVEHGLDDPFSVDFETAKTLISKAKVYGAIWTDIGLIYVAKMNGVLPDGNIDWRLL